MHNIHLLKILKMCTVSETSNSPLPLSHIASINVTTGTPFLVHQLPPCFVRTLISFPRAVASIACCSSDTMPYRVVQTLKYE